MAHFKDPNTFLYDATAIAGVTGVQTNETAAAQTLMADDGAATHFVTKGAVTFSVTTVDKKEAAKLARKVDAAKNITFKVNDETDTDAGTVTLVNAKTGGLSGGYGPGGTIWTVNGVADSVSDPTV